MLSVQRITPDNIDFFKAIRLRPLQDAPSAFGSTYEREATFSDKDWRARIERWNGEMGISFLAMNRDLSCGIAGSHLESADRRRAELVSMWIAPTPRRQGIGSLLVKSVIEWVRSLNAHALRLMATHTNEGLRAKINVYLRIESQYRPGGAWRARKSRSPKGLRQLVRSL